MPSKAAGPAASPAPKASCTASPRPGTRCSTGWRSSWAATSPRRPARARGRCSCSTAGWDASRPPTTASTCCRTAAARSSSPGRRAFRGSTSAPTRRRSLRTSPQRAATSSAWTGASRSTRRGAGSARGRSRETSTPRPCWRLAPRSPSGCATSWRAPGGGPDTSSISGTACFPRRRSRPHRRSSSWCMAAERCAVLLMAYGGPGNLDEVEPYLLDVRGGRPTSPELVEEIRGRYARIGGGAPSRRARLREGLARFPDPARVPVIFTAHSLPQRILANGDPYPDEFRASVAAVVERLALARWHLAFQSAGATPEPWLGPDAGEVLRALAAEGGREALIAPIGFVCDHVEILYDVDVEYRALAARLGMRLERTASLNDDPLLIACLADLARRAASDRGWR